MNADNIADDSQNEIRNSETVCSKHMLISALAMPSGLLVSERGQKILQNHLAKTMPADALSEVPASMEFMESASEVNHNSSSVFYRISDAVSVDSSLVVRKKSGSTVLKGHSSNMLSGSQSEYICS